LEPVLINERTMVVRLHGEWAIDFKSIRA